MNELHLFAGGGGGILGGMLLGHRPVCAVEIEPYCRNILLQRQRDGILPWFPIWDDVRTFPGHEWRGRADIVCGGFPCQDISVAGKGAGIDGERSGLWGEMARIIREVGPRYVFVENSPALVVRGLEIVLGDLAEMGFNAEWGVLAANDVGFSHRRERIWIVAHNSRQHGKPRNLLVPRREWGASAPARRLFGNVVHALRRPEDFWGDRSPVFCRAADGMARAVDQLRAIGNGQVPAVAALAWRILERGGV